jgi:23S rRNA (pseudouridine1915-N3)-methyltransferase
VKMKFSRDEDKGIFVKIRMICVGVIKETYLKEAIQEYIKRLSRFTKCEIVEVKDESIPENVSKKEIQKILSKEKIKIEKFLERESVNIMLDIRGTALGSEEFSKKN